MGLDSVEILMKVENTFGIQIPQQEVENILTVGDFHDAVWRHLPEKYSDKCKSQALFYKLRKAFAENFHFAPAQFMLSTSPDAIFPKNNRRKAYKTFAQTINLALPRLTLSYPWSIILNVFGLVSIAGGLAASFIMINFFNYTKWMLLLPVGGIMLTILVSNLLEPMRTKIENQTIRAFTEQTLMLNYAIFFTNEGTNRREVESVINQIISDMAAVNLEEITPEKKIADDLGID